MTDPNEIEALKASMRGALSTAALLESVRDRVEQLDPHAPVPPEELEELGRLSLSNAVAAQAFRGLVETIRNRQTGM
jgi:HAMP domain-containing protein